MAPGPLGPVGPDPSHVATASRRTMPPDRTPSAPVRPFKGIRFIATVRDRWKRGAFGYLTPTMPDGLVFTAPGRRISAQPVTEWEDAEGNKGRASSNRDLREESVSGSSEAGSEPPWESSEGERDYNPEPVSALASGGGMGIGFCHSQRTWEGLPWLHGRHPGTLQDGARTCHERERGSPQREAG